jgi:hypothetical protein
MNDFPALNPCGPRPGMHRGRRSHRGLARVLRVSIVRPAVRDRHPVVLITVSE